MIKKLKILLHFPVNVWQMFITYFPGPLGFVLRWRFWKKRLKYLGERVQIDIGVNFQNPQYITLDDACWIDKNVTILAGPPFSGRLTFVKENPLFSLEIGDVYIGKQTHIAQNCVLSGIGGLYIGCNSGVASNSTIYSFSHHYRNLVDREDKRQYFFTPLARHDRQSMILGPVFIGNYSAIGLNSVVLPGACIEHGSWVASGSVISGRYTAQSLLIANQSIIVKSLDEFEIIP